jgi:hypothetical protein
MTNRNYQQEQHSFAPIEKSLQQLFANAESQYLNLTNALMVAASDTQLATLTAGTFAEGENPADIELAIEAIFARRFGETPAENDRLQRIDLQRELDEEFFTPESIRYY